MPHYNRQNSVLMKKRQKRSGIFWMGFKLAFLKKEQE
jgi:hypothetical protein